MSSLGHTPHTIASSAANGSLMSCTRLEFNRDLDGPIWAHVPSGS